MRRLIGSVWRTAHRRAQCLRMALAFLPIVLAAVPAHGASLEGRLLVATEQMGDPRFTETVIFMVHHDATGAMGLVVNRQVGRAPVTALLNDLGLDTTGMTGDVRVHVGGPVEPGRAFILHSPDYAIEGTISVGGFGVTARPEVLQAIGQGQGPKQFVFFLGYAGWTAGQLEAEIKAGHWVDVPADAGIIFDDQMDTKWKRAIARRTTVL